MTPNELALECGRVIEGGMTYVQLVVPGAPPRGERIRLDRFGRGRCPMGQVVNWQDNPPRTVAHFKAIDVLAWLAAKGLVMVEAKAVDREAAQ
jgi:hypothetical protein